MNARIPIVILAGGQGRRIGGGKPMRRLGGESLIDRTVRIASGWSRDVRIAVRPGMALDASVPMLIDDETIEGPLAALASALRHAGANGCDRVLLIPCDTPFLPTDLPHRLEKAIGEAGAAVASSGGRLHPACALWRVGALDRLPRFLESGRTSLRAFAEEVGFVAVEWPVAPFDPFFNVNDVDQLRQAETILARGLA